MIDTLPRASDRERWDRQALLADLSAQVRAFSTARALQFTPTIPVQTEEAWEIFDEGIARVTFTMTFTDDTHAQFVCMTRAVGVH